MASRAIDYRVLVLQILDLLQVVIVYGAHHSHHLASYRLCSINCAVLSEQDLQAIYKLEGTTVFRAG